MISMYVMIKNEINFLQKKDLFGKILAQFSFNVKTSDFS
jgi:hypothetical protein